MKALGRAFIAFCIPAFFLVPAMPAQAKVSLTVQPLVAQFEVPPGQAGHVTIAVSNSGSSSQVITAHPLDWRTIADGSIALEKVGAERQHSITRDLSLSSYQFVLAPGERREVTLTLNMPASVSTKPASYWGGFIFNSNDAGAPRNTVGVAATVFAYESVNSPSKNMSLQAMRVFSHDGSATLIARLRNTGASYVRPIAHLMIGQGGRIYRSVPVTINAVFPNATRIVSQNLGHLPPGEYVVELTIDYGGNSILDGITKVRM